MAQQEMDLGYVKGDPGDFESVNVTVDNNTGVPSATASVSGSVGHRSLDLDFKNLKGDKGEGSYSVATTGGAGLCPQLNGSSTKYLNGAGAWTTPPDTDTTYTTATTGKAGLLRALSGTSTQFLNGAGNWATPTNTTYSVVSKSADGLCPKLPSDPNV